MRRQGFNLHPASSFPFLKNHSSVLLGVRCTRRSWFLRSIAFLLAPALARGATDRSNEIGRYDLLAGHSKEKQSFRIHSLGQWRKRRSAILEAMQEVMGPLPGAPKRVPLAMEIEEEVDCGSYLRQRLTYQSEPGSRVPAYLLIPKRLFSRKAPGVLALHQTSALGPDIVVGLGKNAQDSYGVELVERGFVCLAPPYPLLGNYQPDLRQLGYASGTMKAIWDNIRGVDLLASLPFVDGRRIGAVGHSLGGHNGIFTAVFDERIGAVVSSCGLDTFQDYMGGKIAGWTSERYMPRLLNYSLSEIPFDFPQVIAALAPRLCVLSAPLGDTNFKWWSVDKIACLAQPVYQLTGHPERLRVVHPDCAHAFPANVRNLAYHLMEENFHRAAWPSLHPGRRLP